MITKFAGFLLLAVALAQLGGCRTQESDEPRRDPMSFLRPGGDVIRGDSK